MTRHVDLLAVLYVFWGALALVTGLAILILALGAWAIITSAERAALGPDFAASLTAVTFFLFAAGALAWGGIHVLTGFALRRHRHWARLVGMGLAVLNLFFLPFGTGLAIYTFWALLADETRRLFAPAPRVSPASSTP
ncbi:MAG: hypothetical protein NTY02_10355 [Acidobacteria bacterium]|nr:hypothetical protein [Acidobacteriota bacterium]